MEPPTRHDRATAAGASPCPTVDRGIFFPRCAIAASQSIFQRKAKCHKQVNETILRLTQELTLRTGMQETLASCAFHLYILEVVVSVRDVVQFVIGIVPIVLVV